MTVRTEDKLPAEDRLDIQELFARYAWGLDLGDTEGVLDCFTEDGVLDHLWQGKLEGREAIAKALQELWYDRPSWWYGRQHLANHFLITRDGDEARARAFFSIVQFNVEYRTNFVFGIGTWDNRCVREADGIYRFRLCQVNAWTDASRVPWQGERRVQGGPRP